MDQYPLKWITKSLAVGYAPRSEEDLRLIRAVGVKAIVNLCAECYDLNEVESAFDFDVYYLPVVDEAAPTIEALAKLLDWMKQKINSGKRVLVHCRYGIGRTGTVVLCYLIHSGYDFKKARAMMKATPSWPANREQQELVDRFVARLSVASVEGNLRNAKPKTAMKFFDRWIKFMKWHD